jgi:hypothetical protein
MNTGHLMHDSIWHKPSAWLPIVFSFAALAVVVAAVASHGVALHHQADEGTAAHLWQIFMAMNVLTMGYFVVRWVAAMPRKGLVVLGVQLAATLAAMAPVFLLHL